eukprot:1155101-Pelagomonas_calceolata.AAC.3
MQARTIARASPIFRVACSASPCYPCYPYGEEFNTILRDEIGCLTMTACQTAQVQGGRSRPWLAVTTVVSGPKDATS